MLGPDVNFVHSVFILNSMSLISHNVNDHFRESGCLGASIVLSSLLPGTGSNRPGTEFTAMQNMIDMR